MTRLEVDEVISRDDFDLEDSPYTDMGIRARIVHHTENGEMERNRHAVVMGETVIFVRTAEGEN